MTDQPGKDPEVRGVPEDYTTLLSLYENSSGHVARVILSVVDKHLQKHYVVVPKPISYEAAVLTALHQLGEHIPFHPEATLQDMYFQYRMKLTDIWTTLPNDFWNEIVLDGDELRLYAKPVSRAGVKSPGTQGKTSARYIHLLQKPAEHGISTASKGRVVLFPRPKSFPEAKIVANLLFYQAKSLSKLLLFVRKGSSGGWISLGDTSIARVDWMDLTDSDTEDVEIAVWAE